MTAREAPSPTTRRERLSHVITHRKPTLFGNTVTNMVWYVLQLVQGFILPRLISDSQGRDMLGVWDLGWTLVFYTNLLALGTDGAVARFVARHRAVESWTSLNKVVNSSLVVLSTGCLLGLVAAGLFTLFIPALVSKGDEAIVADARWVIFLLSASAALQLPGGAFNSVITGCERFDLLNLARGTRDLAVLIISAILLGTGHSLVTIAALVLAAELIADVTKLLVARKLVPSLEVTLRHWHWHTAKELIFFGGKTVVRNLCRGGTYQFNSLLVSFFMGPSLLAVFARQRAPVSHAMKFMNQYAQVFIPKSSALDADGDNAALQKLLITSTRYGLYLTMPMIALLLVMGTPLMTVWMGTGYVAPAILMIFTLSHALLVPQQSAYSILLGMNCHGRASLYEIAGLVLSLLLGVVLMGPLKLGLIGGAIAVCLPLALSNGIWMPLHACRMLGLSFERYLRESLPGPLVAAIPCVVVLGLCRWYFAEALWTSIIVGSALTALVMAPIYWFAVMPATLRERLVTSMTRMLHWRESAKVHQTRGPSA